MSATVEYPDVGDVAVEIVAAVLEELGESLSERRVRDDLIVAVQIILAKAIESAVESATEQVAMEMGEMEP